jgi:hypothetical protein
MRQVQKVIVVVTGPNTTVATLGGQPEPIFWVKHFTVRHHYVFGDFICESFDRGQIS